MQMIQFKPNADFQCAPHKRLQVNSAAEGGWTKGQVITEKMVSFKVLVVQSVSRTACLSKNIRTFIIINEK